jgi:hypothetical protein
MHQHSAICTEGVKTLFAKNGAEYVKLEETFVNGN